MSQVLINEESMSAIGDAIRSKKGEDKYSHDIIVNDYPVVDIMHTSEIVYPYYKIPWSLLSGATKMDMVCYPAVAGEVAQFRFGWTRKGDGKLYEITSIYVREPYAPESILTFFSYIDTNNYNTDYLYVRKIDGQSSKITTDKNYDVNPETNYLPSEMGDEINNLVVAPASAFNLTGNCDYLFTINNSSWMLKQYLDKISSYDISSCAHMFENNILCQGSEKIDFSNLTLNLSTSDSTSISSMFAGCSSLIGLPILNGAIGACGYAFSVCHSLREITDEWVSHIDFSKLHLSTSNQITYVFQNCYSLRKISQLWIDNLYQSPTSSSSSYYPYSGAWNSCHVLEELNNIPVCYYSGSGNTSNLFNNTFSSTYRLKKITFKANEDGSPIVAKWKSQTIDLT